MSQEGARDLTIVSITTIMTAMIMKLSREGEKSWLFIPKHQVHM